MTEEGDEAIDVVFYELPKGKAALKHFIKASTTLKSDTLMI